MRTPLRRVAVTRDEPIGGPLDAALRGLGLQPMPCPAVVTAPPRHRAALAEAAGLLEEYDWLVVASARAVDALAAAGAPRTWPASLRTAAVGAATAKALSKLGAPAPLAGPGGARELLDLLAGADHWAGRSVLLPRAEEGLPTLAEGLRALGARVDEVVAYRTLPVPPAALLRAWHAAAPEAAIVTSPSASSALLRALGPRSLRALRGIVAIGPTTAAPLRAAGVPVVLAPSANLSSVAEATSALWPAGAEA